MPDTLSPQLLQKTDAYWRAVSYLTVGQIHPKDDPLLEVPLPLEHLETRLLGHWSTTTGLNFIYVYLNRLIKLNDLDMIYVIGPGLRCPLQVVTPSLLRHDARPIFRQARVDDVP